MLDRLHSSAVAMACSLAVSACGGSADGGGPAPIPAPPSVDTSRQVQIFPDPKPETYTTVGILGPDHLTADADMPHIRYTADGHYELQLPGKDWELLHWPANFVPQYPDTVNTFTSASGALSTSNSRLQGYRYSEIGNGGFAFGSATPASAVPVTGTAAFDGVAQGYADLTEPDGYGGMSPISANGTVHLQFDFQGGTLGGSMALKLQPSTGSVDLGTFAFKDTVFSAGSPTYSGAFVTPATGLNEFFGRFTGPGAQETIGAWAVPFIYNLDGKSHQLTGAWIAKR